MRQKLDSENFITPKQNKQVISAKNKLWESSDLSIIGEYAKRKTTSLRSECEAHVQDILTALTQLDLKDKMPLLTIDYLSLSCIPRSHPEELTNISFVDRLNRLEKSLIHLQQVVDGNMAGNMN